MVEIASNEDYVRINLEDVLRHNIDELVSESKRFIKLNPDFKEDIMTSDLNTIDAKCFENNVPTTMYRQYYMKLMYHKD